MLPRSLKYTAFTAFAVLIATPLLARDSLGMSGDWGAFRDPGVPRCYAIAKAETSAMRRDFQPYATVSTWPRKQLRGQVYFRLSRRLAEGRPVTLTIGGQRFKLLNGPADAWAEDRQMDAAIVAAMRTSARMYVSARDDRGNRFGNSYNLTGSATALDAATLACAKLR